MDLEGRSTIKIDICLDSPSAGLPTSLSPASQISHVVPSIDCAESKKDEEFNDGEVDVEGDGTTDSFADVSVPVSGKIPILSIEEAQTVLRQISIHKQQNNCSVEELRCEYEILDILNLL